MKNVWVIFLVFSLHASHNRVMGQEQNFNKLRQEAELLRNVRDLKHEVLKQLEKLTGEQILADVSLKTLVEKYNQAFVVLIKSGVEIPLDIAPSD